MYGNYRADTDVYGNYRVDTEMYGNYRVKPRLSRFPPHGQSKPLALLTSRRNVIFCPPVDKSNFPHQMATFRFQRSSCLIWPSVNVANGELLLVTMIGPTCHYDVIDFVFVAKPRDRAAWQQTAT